MFNKINSVTCSFSISDKCYKTQIITKSSYNSNIKRNKGKYRCKACAMFNNSKRLKTYDDFFDNITEIQAYMLGVIAGDGNIKGNTIRIVAQKSDIETLELFQTHICPESKICKYKNCNCYYISFTSRKISKTVCKLLSIKPGKKSDAIKMPNLADYLLWHFIRGLIDTDGSIRDLKNSKSTYPHCSYASKSNYMKNSLKNFCDINNILYVTDKVSVHFNGQHCISFLDNVYKNNNYSLSRKRYLYLDSKKWISGMGNPFRPQIKRGPKIKVINK